MKQYNVHAAKTHLSRLLEKVAQGEDVVISKDNKPVAVLKKYPQSEQERQGGQLKGQIWIAPDFDNFDDELQNMFGIKE